MKIKSIRLDFKGEGSTQYFRTSLIQDCYISLMPIWSCGFEGYYLNLDKGCVTCTANVPIKIYHSNPFPFVQLL